MNRTQINLQNMHLVVVEYLNNNQTIVVSNPLVLEAANALKPVVASITATSLQRQSIDRRGYTASKNNALDNLFSIAADACLKARPYARKIKDAVLLKAIDHNFSDLHDTADNKGIALCNGIVAALQPHLSALQPYKVTQATLTEISNAITAATPKAAERDVVNAASIKGTADLHDLFKQAKAALLELDELIEGQLSDTHKDFVDTYFITRRIIDTKGGGGSKVEEGKK
ncbi:MAG: hypothetical protein QM541_00835 [Flavobacterium sp.]|nr:hypothetical protein [Flavobacterium sp.]